MIVYIVWLDPTDNVLFIGVAENESELPVELKLLEYRTGVEPILLEEYLQKFNMYEQNVTSSYIELMKAKLQKKGYRVITSADASSSQYNLYVIHVDDPNSNRLYVGQTAYPIEIRFLQHKYNGLSDKRNVMAARMFRTGQHYAHSIAYDLILDKSDYNNKDEAENAENALGEKLCSKGYDAHWA